MPFSSIPKSLALIPDGNRRWARSHRLSILDGYNLGVKKFIDFSEWCMGYGINNLTVWALSSENVKRSTYEVKALFNIYRRVSKDRSIMDRLESNGIRVNVVSNKKLLPKDLVSMLEGIEKKTENNKKGVINMLMEYGGKDDLVYAARRIAALAEKGREISADIFKSCLLSYQVPEIDMIIRTSGEQRLSGFVPWQTSYSELYFSKKLWPDFTRKDLNYALLEYDKRDRRFGK
ncbi:MAG: polyprenyl diphosphate synthase [Candidatus Micrarchaeaceae archaeon]